MAEIILKRYTEKLAEYKKELTHAVDQGRYHYKRHLEYKEVIEFLCAEITRLETLINEYKPDLS